MLNPSTADASQDDPTIRKCVEFSKRLGFGGMTVVNLYALRSTKPKKLWKHPDPIGNNNHHIKQAALAADMVVCAWGANPKSVERGRTVYAMLKDWNIRPYCLGTTKNGSPKHPLYVPYKTTFKRFRGVK
jgi:hypothetical protein